MGILTWIRRRLFGVPRFRRTQYRQIWDACAVDDRSAMESVAGHVDLEHFRWTGAVTRDLIHQAVQIQPTDVVLEIGAGIGRVGEFIAPMCQTWIGADVSPRMLAHLERRLASLPNVQTRLLTGFDLSGVADSSVDVVYSTVVFMHLDEWDRWSYVREAMRVLRPGGRLWIDNFNIVSEKGWEFFLSNARYPPLERPPHISRSSTPEELRIYLERAGFVDILQRPFDLWITTWGTKSAATDREEANDATAFGRG